MAWRLKSPAHQQSVKKLFSASLLFSKQNRPLFTLGIIIIFHINNFIHVVKQMHKMSGKYLKNIQNLFFSIPLFHFQAQFSIMGLWNSILQYNTLSMMCILVTGLKWRPQGGTQNKQRASVRLYWLPSPLTACRPPKYPVSASVLCTNSTKVFDALRISSHGIDQVLQEYSGSSTSRVNGLVLPWAGLGSEAWFREVWFTCSR